MRDTMGWFIDELKCKYNVYASPDEISYETVELYKEEIDETLIPNINQISLPEPLIIELIQYMNKQKKEYLAAIVVEEGTKKWLYVSVIINQELDNFYVTKYNNK